MKSFLAFYFFSTSCAIVLFGSHITDARLMNFVIMSLYAMTILWWLFHQRPWDAAYWASAFAITFVVTFGYGR